MKYSLLGLRESILLFCSLLLLGSCVSKKQLIYMQGAPSTKELLDLPRKTYKLQEGDVLRVEITSLDAEINTIFSTSGGNSVQPVNLQGGLTNLLGYVVNGYGYIKLPIIGEVEVKGKTVEDAERNVQEAVSEYLKGATSTVKLLSPRISILGEVRQPGTLSIFRNEINIFEAIGMAGDLNVTADRKNVRILRPQGDKQLTYTLDLTDGDIMEKEGFFLQPNDVVYIPPNAIKSGRDNLPVGSTVFSSILSLITTSLLILQLVNRN